MTRIAVAQRCALANCDIAHPSIIQDGDAVRNKICPMADSTHVTNSTQPGPNIVVGEDLRELSEAVKDCADTGHIRDDVCEPVLAQLMHCGRQRAIGALADHGDAEEQHDQARRRHAISDAKNTDARLGGVPSHQRGRLHGGADRRRAA